MIQFDYFFQLGWNHQLEEISSKNGPFSGDMLNFEGAILVIDF